MEDDKNECSRKLRLHYPILIAFIIISTLIHDVSADDAVIMAKIAKSFTKTPNGWSGSNPCKWSDIQCDGSGKVTSINLSGRSLSGEISSEVKQLSNLKLFNVQKNQLSGPLPPLSNMPALEEVHLDDNNFTSIPSEFLSGLPSLQEFSMDDNINLPPWTISDTLTESSSLVSFSADNARVSGPIPDIFGSFPSLQTLKLAYNNLTGPLPASLGKSGIQLFTLNNQLMGLEGSIDVIGSMKELNQVWLHVNQFTGPIPDLSGLESLFDIQLRDNQLTGVIPDSLGELPKLANITLQNNKFQGPFPSFPNNIKVSLGTTNGFCNTSPGPCDPRVTTLLEVASTLGYPLALADSWQGNDPCKGWDGIICSNGAITVINFAKRDFSGTISPSIAKISSLKSLILSDNKLYGTIPDELTDLPQLQLLDITNNNISGKIPSFSSKVILKTSGNKFIGKDVPITVPPGLPGTSKSPGTNTTTDSVSTGVIVASVLAGIIFVVILCFVIYKYVNKKSKTKSFMKDSEKGKQEERTQSEYILSGTMSSDVPRQSQSSRSNSEVNQYDGSGGKNLIPMEVLREVTDNFSDDNILGRGGFGIVYKGQLHDGTMIAVKRMEASLVSSKGLSEFKAEIDVLTKVRHRHLVALHGFCENGNERLLVYEYMPQGTLSQHIFKNDETRGPPLTWKQRVTIALDVARGVEYLHTFAQQSFIHRDLKPSNVLLGDDMRAKVSDFGLVKSAPDGKYSVETKLAGTFGYLAPEYAATGRVTLKVDVYAFGVILMEIITGRKALDEKQPDDKAHLVTWFRRSLVNLEAIKEALDPNLKLDEETFESICKVVELAGHCTGREPHQRPDMGHVVSVLSPLVETWTPGRSDLENDEDSFGIDIHMSLPQAIQRWKANENTTDTYTFPSINVSKKFTDSTGSFSSSEAR